MLILITDYITYDMSYSIMDTLGVMLAVFAIASLVIKNYWGVMVSSLLCAITVILSITMVDLHTMPHFEMIEAYGVDVSGIELEPTKQTIAAIVLLVVAFGVAAFLQFKSRKQSEDNYHTALTILGCIAIPIVWLTNRHSVWTIILTLIIGFIYINAENFFEVFYENLYGYSEMGDEQIAQIEHHDKLVSALKWSGWGVIITSIAIPIGRIIRSKMKSDSPKINDKR